MIIYISSNIYQVQDLENIFPLVEKLQSNNPNIEIGIELFPEFQTEKFDQFLAKYSADLKRFSMSLHGPYIATEHSAPKGSVAYEKSTEYFKKSLQLANEVNASYIVYHHNNRPFNLAEKPDMIKTSSENLLELTEMATEYDVEIVVENAGVNSRQNALFNEIEFIDMAKKVNNPILIDIGHAIANKWDLEKVVCELQDKIIAYHLHNNDGEQDLHDSILNGVYDINDFIHIYHKYTPTAKLVIEYAQSKTPWDDIMDNDIKTLLKK